jgi:hypothetical protein
VEGESIADVANSIDTTNVVGLVGVENLMGIIGKVSTSSENSVTAAPLTADNILNLKCTKEHCSN